VDRSHIITTSTGAVTLAVAAPVLISFTGLACMLWPVIPILTVGSIWFAVKKQGYDNNNTNNTNNTGRYPEKTSRDRA
jgi:hypothetical protein